MKAIVWDIESTDLELAIRTYQLKNHIRYFNPNDIVRDWTMLGAAWLDLDSDKPGVCSVSPDKPLDDYGVVKKLHQVLSEADCLIGHNSDNFDLKKFNTRALLYDLPPLSPKIKIDTLKLARKHFAFTSNKLAYIAKELKVDCKDESPDWNKCIEGDAKELRYMRKYNKQDVIVTKQVYLKLRSYHETHPNMNYPIVRAANGDAIEVCRVCQSPDLVVSKHRITNAGVHRIQKQCKECDSYTTFGRVKQSG